MRLAISSGLWWLMAFTKAWAIEADTISIILAWVASKSITAFFIASLSIPAYSQTENLQLSAAQWREDLAFLARELPARHANAFHYTPREQFEAAVASLDRQIAHLESDAVWTGMQRIVALVGDGHTYLQTPSDAADFPIEIARFGEDYRIASVVVGLENALGGRVLKVDETPISHAAELALPLAARDENPPQAQAFVEDALTTGATLHGLGITPDRNAARYTLADDAGREFSVVVQAVPPGANLPRSGRSSSRPSIAKILSRSSGAGISRMCALSIAMFAPCEICTQPQRRCWVSWRSTIRIRPR